MFYALVINEYLSEWMSGWGWPMAELRFDSRPGWPRPAGWCRDLWEVKVTINLRRSGYSWKGEAAQAHTEVPALSVILCYSCSTAIRERRHHSSVPLAPQSAARLGQRSLHVALEIKGWTQSRVHLCLLQEGLSHHSHSLSVWFVRGWFCRLPAFLSTVFCSLWGVKRLSEEKPM